MPLICPPNHLAALACDALFIPPNHSTALGTNKKNVQKRTGSIFVSRAKKRVVSLLPENPKTIYDFRSLGSAMIEAHRAAELDARIRDLPPGAPQTLPFFAPSADFTMLVSPTAVRPNGLHSSFLFPSTFRDRTKPGAEPRSQQQQDSYAVAEPSPLRTRRLRPASQKFTEVAHFAHPGQIHLQ